MDSPTQTIWRLHGSPAMDVAEPASGHCYVCAGPTTRGVSVADWMASNYTDMNKARCPSATHTCEACVFVMSRTSPVLGRPAKEGMKFGGNFRNYSHMVEGTTYINASKGEKPLVREFLRLRHAESWFCAIADSGQKHVVPWVPWNGPGTGGRVLFDEQLITVPPTLALVDVMTDMLSLGMTKEELERGSYRSGSWKEYRAKIEEFESDHGTHHRGGSWFTLALWLAQRDESITAARLAANAVTAQQAADAKAAARNSHRGSRTGRAPRTPSSGRKRNETLDTARDEHAECSSPNVERERVGQSAPAENASGKSAQLGLFGGL